MLKQRDDPMYKGSREPDKRLSQLLRMWPGIEPDEDFERSVMQRIASVKEPETGQVTLFGRRRHWNPAWTAAAAAVLVGIGLGMRSWTAAPAREAPHPLLHPRTVVGSYLSALKGETS